MVSGFGGLEDACWPLVPKFAGSNPAEAVGFFRAKNPQHSFLSSDHQSKSGGLSPTDFDLFSKLKKPLRGKRFRSIEEVSNEVT
jgi:hypothetical protein